MPRCSIVIPVFNAEATLSATISSIATQSLADWELILVDDGSSDKSWQIARDYAAQDARITVLRNPGKGPSAARNIGALKHANGDILAFCDADDLWLPDKLADVCTTLENGSAEACFGRVGFFRHMPDTPRTRSSVPEAEVSIPMLMGENPVCTLSNLSIRREVFRATGGFREDMVHNEDLEFLIRLVGQGHRLHGLQADHVRYRLSPLGLSSDLSAMRAGRNAALKTAAVFGHAPDPRAEAIHLRYLARRALRLDALPETVRRLVLDGVRTNPMAFLFPLRRGGLIAISALLQPLLPRSLRHALFAN